MNYLESIEHITQTVLELLPFALTKWLWLALLSNITIILTNPTALGLVEELL